MSHERTVHGGAVVFALTGDLNQDPGIPGVRGPDASANDPPNLGAAIRAFGPPETDLPNAVVLPWKMIDGQGREPPGQWAGVLGKNFNPWLMAADPNQPEFRLDALTLPGDISLSRLGQRRELLHWVDQQARYLDRLAEVGHVSQLHQQASRLLASRRVRRAFALAEEPPAVRDRYGRNTFGQACLLGRRLVEAGTPYVQVNMGPSLFGDFGWDTHSNTFPTMKRHLCPKFDAAFATLIEDLDARGLLEETLVVVNTEFGRKYTVLKNGGRDHWPQCYTLLFAGAGVRRGAVVGQSDRRGAYPTTPALSPADVAATLLAAAGVDPATEIRDSQNRPVRLNKGRILHELFG